jgi:hypothetical protein
MLCGQSHRIANIGHGCVFGAAWKEFVGPPETIAE